jgi:hypothetical protein
MPYAESMAVGRNIDAEGKWYPAPPPLMVDGKICADDAEWRTAYYKVRDPRDGSYTRYDRLIRDEPWRAQEQPPLMWRLRRRTKYLPDRLNHHRTHGNFTCSSRFKALVEEVNPNIHLFFPIQILQPNLDPWPELYWMFECRVFVQAIVVEESPGLQWVPLDDPRDGYVRQVTTRGYGHIDSKLLMSDWERAHIRRIDPADYVGGYPGSGYCVDRDAIAGHDVWYDPMATHRGHTVFFSDAFAARMRKAKIRGFWLTSKLSGGPKWQNWSYAAPVERAVPPYHHFDVLRRSA